MKDYEVQLPAFEVRVDLWGSEVFVYSGFQAEDVHEGFHIIAGIDNPTSAPTVRALLQKAIEQTHRKDWRTVDELAAAAGTESEERPF